jgi:ATPase subunit of ABC transporter with duplicated ATPase domains
VLLAQALFGHPEAAPRRADDTSTLTRSTGSRNSLDRYDGTLIVISHDRHFLNRVLHAHRGHRLPDHHHYTGGYDDMVMAKTQIRTKIEADNEQREKKIAQLNDFIARFGAGTRASQTTSRRKEVERLQTTELARSNIQRPYIKFTTKRPSGKVPLEFEGLSKAFGTLKVVLGFSAVVNRGEKIVPSGGTAPARRPSSRRCSPTLRDAGIALRSRWRKAALGP